MNYLTKYILSMPYRILCLTLFIIASPLFICLAFSKLDNFNDAFDSFVEVCEDIILYKERK